jgi:adenylate cyclase
VIGDVVNLASRIEQLNKQFDSQLLISEEVWNAVSEHALEAILIGETQVKGRDATIQVYKLA